MPAPRLIYQKRYDVYFALVLVYALSYGPCSIEMRWLLVLPILIVGCGASGSAKALVYHVGATTITITKATILNGKVYPTDSTCGGTGCVKLEVTLNNGSSQAVLPD